MVLNCDQECNKFHDNGDGDDNKDIDYDGDEDDADNQDHM